MEATGVKPGMVIGEVGAGSGYFTFWLSRGVGEGGKVYANDIDSYGLSRIGRRMADEKVKNIETVLGTVEAWGRSADNPVGGWYGIKKGLRGRFGNYVPPVLEVLGLAELEHNARNNRMRAR